jgi:DNA-binding CsgD family transcriptional regulator
MRTPASQSLSPRELEVLMLVADGRPNKNIARTLYISETTVKTHLAHIFTKLGSTTEQRPSRLPSTGASPVETVRCPPRSRHPTRRTFPLRRP